MYSDTAAYEPCEGHEIWRVGDHERCDTTPFEFCECLNDAGVRFDVLFPVVVLQCPEWMFNSFHELGD